MSKTAALDVASVLDSEVSVEVLAGVLDLTPKRIQQLVSEQVLEKAGHGRYPLKRNVQAYLAYLRARLPGPRSRGEIPVGDGEKIDPTVERARLARSQRLMTDLRRAERARRLIPIELAEQEYGRVVSLVQAKLRALPATAAPLVAGQAPQQVLVTLSGLMEAALLDLSSTPDIEPPMDDAEDVLLAEDGELA